MAITKLGAQILGHMKLGVDASVSTTGQPPQKGGFLGNVGRFAMPALFAIQPAMDIASGESSVGGALGGFAGGWGGFSAGLKAFNTLADKWGSKAAPNGKPAGWKSKLFGGGRGFLGFTAVMLGSIVGDMAGSAVGNAIIPWRRQQKVIPDTFNLNSNGEMQ